MKDSLYSKYEIIRILFDQNAPSITIETNWWVLSILLILISAYFIWGRRYSKHLLAKWSVGETTIKIKTPLVEYQNKIVRSWENLYIANRIYIELVTRKAAIPIDEDNDVIKEVYDSWFTLFTAIRYEIKNLPGDFIKYHGPSNTLIDLATEILNNGLRPHLTKHQARFRKWYVEQLEDVTNIGKSPQDIQKNYPQHKELITSMKDVNETLRQYAIELKKLIDGKSRNKKKLNK